MARDKNRLIVWALLVALVTTPLTAQGSAEFSDSQLESAVTGEYYWDSRVDAEQVDVVAEDRLVVLTGTVDSHSQRIAAETIAERVQGVRAVENDLEIDGSAPPPNQPPLVVTRVRQVLDVTVGLSDDTLVVRSPSEGQVLLEGSVDAYADKQRAVSAASNVVGVTEVIDNIAVTPVDTVTDAVIADDVAEAVRRTTTVPLDRIDIFVSGGAVRLEGTLPSWNDVVAVVDAASYTLGVTEVENNLEISGDTEMAERSDARIRQDVRDQLVWDDRVDASTILVEVEDGFVTLSGTVRMVPERRAALSDARAVAGVHDMFNQLDVAVAGEPEETGTTTENALKNALDWTDAVDSSDVGVLYRNGTALLEGSVPSLWEKERVASLVGDIRGVDEVDNRLNVVPTEDVEDEAIAGRITDALTARLFLDAEDITVVVENGVVELTGSVDTPVERRLAYNVVVETEGVIAVEQNVTVDS